MGLVALALELETATALAVLRAAAYATGSSVDEVAADVLDGRLEPEELRGPGG
jgi:hypothetical protein